ncbi:MAG: GGDEF domain-containing protein [Acidaminococcaceae bacterium]|nr:GGDEF domain-containing protein [Acidaminococcaceae bacterium]
MTNSFSVYDATSEDSSELRELISSYSELAARDSFTGLYSKGHANNLLREMFAVQKEHLQLTLALIDIDHFKNVNDRFGYLCGDEFILYVVGKINALNEQCSGWAARIGGDEFLLACPFSDSEYVEKLCRQITEDIAGHSFRKGCSEYSIEISCGVAVYDGKETLEEFLERVDMKMYEHKLQKK